ncbi:MAG: cupin domain-containing protein [Dehalococcoidia bacterium]
MTDEPRIIPNSDLAAGPPTPGMERRQALAQDDLWMGEVRTAPGTVSGWHHHGEHTTYGRILEGHARLEFGPNGEQTIEGGPGDFFVVPPHTVHRESNPGDEDQLIVLMRVGAGQTVFEAPGPDSE